MSFNLPELPFEIKDLAPILSKESFDYHHGKHHGGVVAGSNAIVKTMPELQGKSLEEVMLFAASDSDYDTLLFNAAQHWNHSLYWLSLSPPKSTEPSRAMTALIDASFGDMAGFKTAFVDACVKRIGSGWTWLVADSDKLSIETTINYDVPLVRGKHLLATCDVWEHTYYLDYRNDRKTFAQIFVDQLLNWNTVEQRLNAPNGSLDPG
jgi:Fe-Mn family superoxide dismutase